MKRGYAAKIGERLKFLSLLDRPASRRSRSMRRVEGSYIKKKGSLPGGRPLGRKASIYPALQVAESSNLNNLIKIVSR